MAILAFVLFVFWLILLIQLSGLSQKIDALTRRHEQLLNRLDTQKPAPVAPRPPAPAPAPPPLPVPAPIYTPPPEPVVDPESPEPVLSESQPILHHILRWIMVGDADQKGGVSEYSVASTWLLRLGIIALVVCCGYFLKWSIAHGIIGPTGRVLLSAAIGLAMIRGGQVLLRKIYHLIGQGLMGGGLAVLYFAAYATGPMYHLLPLPVVFMLMMGITVFAGLLSVRTDSMLIALLGIIGGFCTPMMLPTPTVNYPVLFSYLFLLGVGIALIARQKNWPLLNGLGLLLTWALVAGSLIHFPVAQFARAFIPMTAIFALHGFIGIQATPQAKRRWSAIDLIGFVFNSALYGVMGYVMIQKAYASPSPAWLTAGLALVHAGVARYAYTRGPQGAPIQTIAMALSGIFAIVTLPILFDQTSLTIGWALLAFAILYGSVILRSPALRYVALPLYGIALGRLLLFDLVEDMFLRCLPAMTPRQYLSILSAHLWTFGLSIGSVAAAYRLERRRSETDQDAGLTTGLYGITLLLLFLYASLEWNNFLSLFFPEYQAGGVSLLWAVFALAFVAHGIVNQRRGLRMTGLMLFALVAAKVFLFDLIHTPIHVRILAFFFLGLALIAGSFIYIRGMNR